MPWYVEVILAVAGYLLLHRIATAPLASAMPSGEIGNAMVGAVGRGLATAGQYVVPILCLAGAAISAWRRRARRVLVDNVTSSDASDVLQGMSWREFEVLRGSSSAKPDDRNQAGQARNAAPQAAKTAAPTCPRCAQHSPKGRQRRPGFLGMFGLPALPRYGLSMGTDVHLQVDLEKVQPSPLEVGT